MGNSLIAWVKIYASSHLRLSAALFASLERFPDQAQ